MSMDRQAGRQRLSIVIPATEVSGLEETLVSVLENRPADCDIIVAHTMRYDDPWNIREEVSFVEPPRGSGLIGCIHAGAAAATGDVIHVLAAGWKATDGWTEPALEHFARGGVAAVVPLAVSGADRQQPVSAGIRRSIGGRSMPVVPRRTKGGITTGGLPSAPTLEAGFWRADVLTDIGFSQACGDALAAADMAAALAAAKCGVVLEPGSVVVSGPSRRRRSSFVAGLHAERLFWRSLPCDRAMPALIAHLGEVMRHAAATAPLGTFAMLAGRLAAVLQVGSCIPRARQLAALRRQAAGNDSPEETARTYRIETSHEPTARPHIEPQVPALKRSA
jgi:hypothetical protein